MLQQGEQNYSGELHNLLSALHPTRIGFFFCVMDQFQNLMKTTAPFSEKRI